MKKNKLFVSLLAAGMLAISPAMADDVVKLTTSKTAGETVSLQINNADGVTVDWGYRYTRCCLKIQGRLV